MVNFFRKCISFPRLTLNDLKTFGIVLNVVIQLSDKDIQFKDVIYLKCKSKLVC